MKEASIEFRLTMDVRYADHLDDDWVADQFLMGDRFTIEKVNGDPEGVIVMMASSKVKRVRRLK